MNWEIEKNKWLGNNEFVVVAVEGWVGMEDIEGCAR